MRAIIRDRPDRVSLSINDKMSEYVNAALLGQDVFGFIGGYFSLIDAISACVSRIGNCALTLSTWTAAKADMDHVISFLARGQVNSCRWIVDRSFQNRQPELCDALRSGFGDDAIRVQPVHCKFALMESAAGNLTLQTSANLNRNRRLENLNISSCPVFFEAYSQLVSEIFSVQKPGDGFNDSSSANRTFKAIVNKGKSAAEIKADRKIKRFQKRLDRAGTQRGTH